MALKFETREIGKVTIIDFSGKITIGEGAEILREAVHDALRKGSRKILLNLGDVSYVDSAGLGQLVAIYTSVKNNGGTLKLLNLMKKVEDLLVITKLVTIFDVEDNEQTAVASF